MDLLHLQSKHSRVTDRSVLPTESGGPFSPRRPFVSVTAARQPRSAEVCWLPYVLNMLPGQVKQIIDVDFSPNLVFKTRVMELLPGWELRLECNDYLKPSFDFQSVCDKKKLSS